MTIEIIDLERLHPENGDIVILNITKHYRSCNKHDFKEYKYNTIIPCKIDGGILIRVYEHINSSISLGDKYYNLDNTLLGEHDEYEFFNSSIIPGDDNDCYKLIKEITYEANQITSFVKVEKSKSMIKSIIKTIFWPIVLINNVIEFLDNTEDDIIRIKFNDDHFIEYKFMTEYYNM